MPRKPKWIHGICEDCAAHLRYRRGSPKLHHYVTDKGIVIAEHQRCGGSVYLSLPCDPPTPPSKPEPKTALLWGAGNLAVELESHHQEEQDWTCASHRIR
jgi:hypothetical protein